MIQIFSSYVCSVKKTISILTQYFPTNSWYVFKEKEEKGSDDWQFYK